MLNFFPEFITYILMSLYVNLVELGVCRLPRRDFQL